MASFEHNHVMSLLGVCLDSEMPLMITPLMVKGSVLEYVRKIKENLPQVQAHNVGYSVYPSCRK